MRCRVAKSCKEGTGSVSYLPVFLAEVMTDKGKVGDVPWCQQVWMLASVPQPRLNMQAPYLLEPRLRGDALLKAANKGARLLKRPPYTCRRLAPIWQQCRLCQQEPSRRAGAQLCALDARTLAGPLDGVRPSGGGGGVEHFLACAEPFQ